MLVDKLCHQTLDNHQMRRDRLTGARMDTAKTWIETSHTRALEDMYILVSTLTYLLPVREMVRV